MASSDEHDDDDDEDHENHDDEDEAKAVGSSGAAVISASLSGAGVASLLGVAFVMA